MKNLDNLSKRILSIGLSLTLVILSATLFISTISPATASTSSNLDTVADELAFPFAAPRVQVGTIMMDYTSVHVPSQDKTYYECMVWNTETGESRLYFYSFDDKKFKAYENNVQLPSSPLD